MQEITLVLLDFKALSREDFMVKRPEPVLLHRTNPGESDPDKLFLAGLKRRQRETVMTPDPELDFETAGSASGVLVIPVRSNARSPDLDRVTVGRSKERDIQLPYDKVSSQHAHFLCSDQIWFLCDEGSTNGTFLNGLQLPRDTPSKIHSGSVVKFAVAEFTFHLAPDFHDYLNRLMSKLKKS